jgi:fatty acid-binding protein DegV
VPVVVVTDSSARIPAEMLAECGIAVVALHILIDGRDLRDGVDDVPPDLYQRAASTAGASPAELAAAYRAALERSGGEGVVAVHLSAESAVFSCHAGRPLSTVIERFWHIGLDHRFGLDQ